MNRNRTLKILVAALLGAGWAQAQAAEPDWDNWQCKFCPFPGSGTTGSASVGVKNVDDDSARFGDYTGLDEEGAYADLDADLEYRSESGYTVEGRGKDLGTDAREFEVEAGHQGTWTVDLFYDKIPRYLDDTAETVFAGPGSSLLTLPDSWVRAGNTSGMSQLGATLRPLDVEYDVETYGLGAEYVQSTRLRYEVDWTRQTKDGFGRTWGSFFGVSAELPKPVDYETDQVNAAVVYTGDDWMVKGAYYGSFFSNKDLSTTWDNPFTGPDQGRMANAPDNKYNQFILSGSFGLDFWDTRVNASYAAGKMEQDDRLLPYTINPGIPGQALPRATFDGEVDTTHADLRVVSRPVRGLRVTAEYRYDERDNQSSRNSWDIVQADSFQSLAAENPLYGYEDTQAGVSADYAFGHGIHAYAGYDYSKDQRDEQSVSETEEDLYWGELKFRATGMLTLTLRAENGDRDASNYRDPSTGAGQAQNPLMRKYYLADRDREAYEGKVEFGFERVSASVKYRSAEDDYDDSAVGLTGTDYDQFAADASVVIGKGLVGSVFYSNENYDSDLVGAGSSTAPNTAPPNWRASTEDSQELWGAALDWPGLLDGKLDLRADWIRSETEGDIHVSTTLDGAKDAFPTLRGKLNSAGLSGVWHFSKRVDVTAGARWEKYDADDWALDGVGPGTIGNVLTFGSEPMEYDLVVLSAGFVYKFGVEDPDKE